MDHPDTATLVPRMTQICGPDGVLTDPQQLATYECDGLTAHRCSPGLVVLPTTAGQVAAIVQACAKAKIPFVARGSGTGLSGGALPRADGVLIVTSKMRRIIAIDAASRRAVVEPGVTNLAVSKAVAPYGLFYAPDPSSQVICSVGGNVAENSGGAHCLKHGFTVHHVTGLEIVTPDGELTWLGDDNAAAPGYDQVGAAVSAIIGAGILPAAIEMMDALSIEAAEAAVACHYPQGAGAVLIVELDGPAAEVRNEAAAVRRLVTQTGAFEIRQAADLDTMQLLRCAFDPAGLCNPGKIFPTPRMCGEVPGVRRGPHPLVAAGQAE